ncbi:B91 [Murid betaherpesvirus 8]|uniref:B91 n=1 Tax=Rat cytomegalovirus (isolate England) TaxID=1261657 RepID=K7XY14_RCMVE|nr:E91 [Murid betaherpesvirus 8]AFX83405.1 E91 [Murid betaherpesvirus 8]AKB93285.1 B91 [Murid betaherpesvirus 8]WEG71878.1 protein UL91 [Murid betaherpesvirus 8]WPH25000.1 B91 [Murid betaherpesvirus 8]WPH25134.1 B91 [Murid betaherpesvirus 8]
MNVILGELKKAGIDHKNLDDVFRFAESLAESCEFFRQPGESRLRVLDLAASLFDHVATECIENVISLGVAGEDNEDSDGSDGSDIDSEEENSK